VLHSEGRRAGFYDALERKETIKKKDLTKNSKGERGPEKGRKRGGKKGSRKGDAIRARCWRIGT